MLFNSLYFLVFLLIVLTVYHGVLRSFAARKLFLLAMSWLFYASWSPRFLLLLMATTYVDFELARAIHRARTAGTMRRAHAWLATSLVLNLGLLAFFKYGLFFYESADTVFGLPSPPWFLSVVAPLGISFYTFHSISKRYRDRLHGGRASEVALVHLRGDPTLIRARLAERQGHFMKADLLASQLATLKEPSDALVVDAAESPVTLVERIRAGLALGR